ncbi:retrotransposon protein, putative, ty1-copia subclass [Tanacetum coccineum]
MFNVSNKRAKHALDSSYLWHCRLGHINKKHMDKLQCDGILQPTHDESNNSAKILLGICSRVCSSHSQYGSNQEGYPKETMGYYFYYPLENKIFVAQNAEFFENSLMVQEASGSHGLLESSESDEGLELIQEEDTKLSENTSKENNEVAPIEDFCVNVGEYELRDLNEPPNYKAALSDPEFDKWPESMNTKIQSMKDNQVWGIVANGYTQTYDVDYGETFSPVADIRAIKILSAM